MRLILLLALAASPLWAQVPAEVKIAGRDRVPQYDLVALKADGAPKGGAVFWTISPLLRPAQVRQNRETGEVIFAAPPGVYHITLRVVWTADKDTGALGSAEVVREVTIEGPVPPPVPPGPGPGPAPMPDAILTRTLQDAFALDAETDKLDLKRKLAALYRQSAETAQDASITTAGRLHDVMATAGRTVGLGGKLANTQRAVSAYLKPILPPSVEAPMDDARRAATRREFVRIADALEAVR
jgi:hypothetical protein